MSAEPLYMTDNGGVLCREHRGDTRLRSSRMRPGEIAEYAAMVAGDGAPIDAPLCESCRKVWLGAVAALDTLHPAPYPEGAAAISTPPSLIPGSPA